MPWYILSVPVHLLQCLYVNLGPRVLHSEMRGPWSAGASQVPWTRGWSRSRTTSGSPWIASRRRRWKSSARRNARKNGAATPILCQLISARVNVSKDTRVVQAQVSPRHKTVIINQPSPTQCAPVTWGSPPARATPAGLSSPATGDNISKFSCKYFKVLM